MPDVGDLCRHTAVESLEFVASDFGIVHALQEWMNTCILLAPEIVRNCHCGISTFFKFPFSVCY